MVPGFVVPFPDQSVLQKTDFVNQLKEKDISIIEPKKTEAPAPISEPEPAPASVTVRKNKSKKINVKAEMKVLDKQISLEMDDDGDMF